MTPEAGRTRARPKRTSTRAQVPPRLEERPKAVLPPIEDLIAAAVNDAVNKVEQQTQARMSSVMSGVALPPGFKLPF